MLDGDVAVQLRRPWADGTTHLRGDPDRPPAENLTSSDRRAWRWANLMRRVFTVNVLACGRCGGRLRLIATLEASDTTRRILRHLALPTEVPPPTPAVDDWAV